MESYNFYFNESRALFKGLSLGEMGCAVDLMNEYAKTEQPLTKKRAVELCAERIGTRNEADFGPDLLREAREYADHILNHVFVEKDGGFVCPMIERQISK